VSDEELQELRAKIRVLEAHRADDARHVRELETKLAEAESFVALRPKLQAKLTQQQTELITARRELADAQQLAELAEGRILDAHEQLEMAMLDKEVAEERAEAVEGELEDIRERLAVAEVELDVLKDGREMEAAEGEEGGVDPAIAGSLAYIQLEKQNARLKEALIRLRDVTSENERDQRMRIQDMEKDIAHLDDLQSAFLDLHMVWLELTLL
jgi:dynactin 1